MVLASVTGGLASYELGEVEDTRGMHTVLISVQLEDLIDAPSVEEWTKKRLFLIISRP
jgi:hypothetical protein